MRIIAGEYRGRPILPPEGLATRPITDRVKQSLFDILSPLLSGANVYDCFAGTGSLGLEGLSRGASWATFFESDRSAVSRLRQNIEKLGVGDRSRVVAGDLFRWLGDMGHTAPKEKRADLVFLDPPYRFVTERVGELQQLARDLAEHHLSEAGMVVFRHDAGMSLALEPLVARDVRTYGSMTIELLQAATGKGT